MTTIIKEITLKELKTLQETANGDIDLTQFIISLQSSIFINISVGTGYSKKKVEWENDDGSFSFRRSYLLVNIIFPELLPFII
jgi:hypothetical protein